MNMKMNIIGLALKASTKIGSAYQTLNYLIPIVTTILSKNLDDTDSIRSHSINLNNNSKFPTQNSKIIFSSDYRHVDVHDSNGKHTSETFSSTQSFAISYLMEQHNNGTTKVHYKSILDHINTTAIRMSDVFKITRKRKTTSHPLFGCLIKHDNNGYYWLNMSL